MPARLSDTDRLLAKARAGSPEAINGLLEHFRPRLQKMVTMRLDRRLASRLNPSDVVQESLVDAHRRLGDYFADSPIPFYTWLRQLAWDRLADLQQQHLAVQKRTVTREQHTPAQLTEQSTIQIVDQLVDRQLGPKTAVIHEEMRERVRGALGQLPDVDREVLVLRFLEELSLQEAAAVLGISEGAVSMRQLRALLKLRSLLGGSDDQ